MTLQERIDEVNKFCKPSDRSSPFDCIIFNQIAIMEALIRIESKFPKEAPFFPDQVNEPAKWEHNNDGSINLK